MPRMPAATDTPATGVAPYTAMSPTMPAMPTMPIVGVPPGAPPPRIASGDPDTFVSAGLANNFNGRVVSGWLLPRKYKTGKKANTYSLTWELTIQADDHTIGKDGLVVEYLKIDNLNQWVPSATDPVWNGTDWVYTPAGGDLASYLKLHNGEAGFPTSTQTPGETAVLPPQNWYGYYAIPGLQNSRDAFMKGTKYEQFTTELKRLDYKKKAPHINWGDFRQFLIGVYGKWVRLPYTFSGGGTPPADANQQGEMTTLCLAEILDLGQISGTGGPVAVPSAQTLTAQLPTQAPAPVAAVAVAAPAPIAAGQTFSMAPGMTPQEIAQQVAAFTAPAPVAAPAPVVQQVEPNPQRNDPAAISAAANEIITQIVAVKGQVTKGELGTPVMEGVAARGLDGATALRLLNTPDWLVADERTFGWVPEKAIAVRLP